MGSVDGIFQVVEFDEEFFIGISVYFVLCFDVDELLCFVVVYELVMIFGEFLFVWVMVDIVGGDIDIIRDVLFLDVVEDLEFVVEYGWDLFGVSLFDVIELSELVIGIWGFVYVLFYVLLFGVCQVICMYFGCMLLLECVDDVLLDWVFFVCVVVDFIGFVLIVSWELFVEDVVLECVWEQLGVGICCWVFELGLWELYCFVQFVVVYEVGLKLLVWYDEEFV